MVKDHCIHNQNKLKNQARIGSCRFESDWSEIDCPGHVRAAALAAGHQLKLVQRTQSNTQRENGHFTAGDRSSLREGAGGGAALPGRWDRNKERGCVHFAKSSWKVTVASFVVIWQNLFNYGLTRLKRFVQTNYAISYLFLSTFNASCMRRKIWCDVCKRKYFGLGGGSERGQRLFSSKRNPKSATIYVVSNVAAHV
jgi:hypothetical protein